MCSIVYYICVYLLFLSSPQCLFWLKELKHEEYMVLFKLVPRTFEEDSLLLVLFYYILLLFCFCFLFLLLLLFQTRVLCIRKRQPFFSFSVFSCQLACLCPRFSSFKISIDVTLLASPHSCTLLFHTWDSVCFGLIIRNLVFCVFGIYITISFSFFQTFYF